MLRKLVQKEDGSFSLEASLVFPVLLLIIFVMLFFCLYIYQKSILVQVASTASERAAYSWDNSFRDPRTGAFTQGQRDSLYWRLKDDVMLGALFGWAGANHLESVQVPDGSVAGSLPVQKLSNAESRIPAGMQGQMTYENSLVHRKVTTELNRIVKVPLLNQFLDQTDLQGKMSAGVVEPVEWIRTVELVRYYGAKFMGRGSGEKVDPAGVGQVLMQYGQNGK
ncbi:pilus assembly protein TadE [Paenibacillus kribbensis]|uniref:Pilus assembly protein TadE n=1 Tax=Paenibacillus kribbensis TaxID=172713 RepID=A0A222WRT3_9BACL|nr:TadE family protein [Paenibacillus kribbensis]ASR48564.1 pilus assembly protein TadE [Paenibacillus kribbensis]